MFRNKKIVKLVRTKKEFIFIQLTIVQSQFQGEFYQRRAMQEKSC